MRALGGSHGWRNELICVGLLAAKGLAWIGLAAAAGVAALSF